MYSLKPRLLKLKKKRGLAGVGKASWINKVGRGEEIVHVAGPKLGLGYSVGASLSWHDGVGGCGGVT